MARPVTIDMTAVLEAARKVFLRDGVRASAAQVAREAGVSEGSLFKRFRTKAEFFMAAMQVETKTQAWEERLDRAPGRAPIRETLLASGLDLLQRMRVFVPRIILARSSGITLATDYCFHGKKPPLQQMRVLARYFEAETKLGRLTVRDPRIAAHAFIGALSHYAFCETVFKYRAAAPQAYVRGIVDGILRATAPEPAGRKRQPRKHLEPNP